MEKYLGLPPVASAHGGEVDHLIGYMHWLMLILFLGWGAFYIFVLIRFRRSRNPKASYTGVKSHFSSYLEATVAVIEVVLLVGISIPLWSKRVNAFPAEKDALVIRVVAEQFAWNIHYPGPDGKFGKASITLVDQNNPLGLDRNDPDAKDDITTLNQLYLPVNKPVIIHLSSKDVIHSFNLPTMRVKQDAIPGMDIPVWFTPTKTTAEVREELRTTYSVSKIMSKVFNVQLPEPSQITLSKGASFKNYILVKDYADSSGGNIGSKGDLLDKDNVEKLVEAGIINVIARKTAGLDKYVSMSDYEDLKDTAGAVLLNSGDTFTEDVVTKLTDIGIMSVKARPVGNVDNSVSMDSYSDKSGTAIVNKGDALSDQILNKLGEAGIGEIAIAPATPTEIACAQLCGLGHYRMRGYIDVVTQEEFDKWMADQEAVLAPSTISSDSTAVSSATETHN